MTTASLSTVVISRAQHVELSDVRDQMNLLQDVFLPLDKTTRDLQVDVIQVQQFLSDASANHHADSFDDAAKEIKTLISQASMKVSHGVGLVGETGRAFDRISQQISQIDNGIGDIAVQAIEQSSTLKQVNVAFCELDQVTQQNAAMAEVATAACHALTSRTESLAEMVRQFVVEPEEDGAAIGRNSRTTRNKAVASTRQLARRRPAA